MVSRPAAEHDPGPVLLEGTPSETGGVSEPLSRYVCHRTHVALITVMAAATA
jgi:hypothetical protein